MADEADRSQMQEEFNLHHAMAHRKPSGPMPCGCCHNCEEPVEDQAQFCGPECRDDFERRNRKR